MKAFRNKLNKKSAGFTLVEIMIVVLIIGILLAIAIPNFVQARESSRAKSCVANLKQIDSAKQQYMMNANVNTFTGTAQATAGAVFGGTDGGALSPTYLRAIPKCPAGGLYDPKDATTSPTCSLSAAAPYNSTGTYPHYLP